MKRFEPLFRSGSAGERQVEVVPLPGSSASLVGMAEEVGKLLARISMEVGDPNVGSRIENVLRAVAVVVVDVENRHFSMACMPEQLCGNRRVVEVAVPAAVRVPAVPARPTMVRAELRAQPRRSRRGGLKKRTT